MKKSLRNLLISIGAGYHPAVRLLHSAVKDKSDSKILILNLIKPQYITEDLRVDYSITYNEFKKSFDLLKGWISKNQFELIGISFMSHHWQIFVEVSKIIRNVLPDCKIVAGGAHPWHIDPLGTLEHCDYVCAAEGEKVYSELIDRLSNPENVFPLCIPGLIEKKGNEIIHIQKRELIPLDELPMPTIGSDCFYELFSLGDRPVFKNEDSLIHSPFKSIHVGRGCPFRCTFCINSLVESRTVRIRSVDKVIEEIKALLNIYKPKAIIFMDEIFPLKHDWLNEFAFKYNKDIGLPFQITLFPGMISYQQAKLLKDSGLREVSIGIQSGSEHIRKYVYNRNDKNKDIIEESHIFSKLKIMAYYDFIISNPFESVKDLQMSLELVRNLKQPFYLKFHTLAFYPKHPISKMALENRLIEPGQIDATIGYLDVTTPHKVAIARHGYRENELLIWHGKLKKEALGGSAEALYYLLMAYHGFWFTPGFILRYLNRSVHKKKIWVFHAFASIIQSILLIRGNFLFRKIYLVISLWRLNGFTYVANKVRSKMMRMVNNEDIL